MPFNYLACSIKGTAFPEYSSLLLITRKMNRLPGGSLPFLPTSNGSYCGQPCEWQWAARRKENIFCLLEWESSLCPGISGTEPLAGRGIELSIHPQPRLHMKQGNPLLSLPITPPSGFHVGHKYSGKIVKYTFEWEIPRHQPFNKSLVCPPFPKSTLAYSPFPPLFQGQFC